MINRAPTFAYIAAVLASGLLACSGTLKRVPPVQIPGAELTVTQWGELRGWAEDDHVAAYAAFRVSCQAVMRAASKSGDTRADGALGEVCRRALAFGVLDEQQARRFFEDSFMPVRVNAAGEEGGLVTGYYVPVFSASRVRTPEFQTPVYAKPPSRADLSFTREEIENGALAGKGLELLWVKDPVDAFFAQIQGSARVRLEDGTVHKLEYAGKNDHPYTAVGRILIERGLVSREEMSMQRIRAWMSANADAAVALRRENKSFVYFALSPSSGAEEGTGAQGVALIPQRSIAVDHTLHPYGTPFFITTDLPIESEQTVSPFCRLMIAMDTGTAIVGPARADIYWGVGEGAADIAGRVKHRGTFTVLVARRAATAP